MIYCKRSIEVPQSIRPSSDRMAILLGELLWRTSLTKERRSWGHWIPVHSTDWRALLGSRYNPFLREAIQAGYVEVNPRYKVGEFSKSFRLASPHRNPRTSRYWLESASYESRIRLCDSDDIGQALVDRFPLVRIGKRSDGWDGFAVRQVRAGAHYATRCQYGRLHTSFTSMSKKTRATIESIDGDRLVEVDVKNAQPTILGALDLRQANQTQTNPTTTHTTTNTNQPNNTPNPICGASRRAAPDTLDYLDCCERGLVYECILNLCGGLTLHDFIPAERRHKHGKDRALKRSDVKRQFITMLFANNATTRLLPVFHVFEQRFPSVAEFIIASKRDEYQELARNCQRLESSIVINDAANQFMHELPCAPLISIHDALAVRPQDVSIAKKCLTEAFGRHGIRPSFG